MRRAHPTGIARNLPCGRKRNHDLCQDTAAHPENIRMKYRNDKSPTAERPGFLSSKIFRVREIGGAEYHYHQSGSAQTASSSSCPDADDIGETTRTSRLPSRNSICASPSVIPGGMDTL